MRKFSSCVLVWLLVMSGLIAVFSILPEDEMNTSGEWRNKSPHINYAPMGMPDFDQRQRPWQSINAGQNGFLESIQMGDDVVVNSNPGRNNVSIAPGMNHILDSGPGGDDTPEFAYCGPTAAANALWWLDSKYSDLFGARGDGYDNHSLVIDYGVGDDHDPANVPLLIKDLAVRFQTNMVGETNVTNMVDGLNQYLIDRNQAGNYSVRNESWPMFEMVAEEVNKCNAAILFLGFYDTDGNRIGGHIVTVAGVEVGAFEINISDPIWNIANPIADYRAYNDTANVSHDNYVVMPGSPHPSLPPQTWWLQGYVSGYNYLVPPIYYGVVEHAVYISSWRRAPHLPIRINSNADFDFEHGVIRGSGTALDPWIIEYYDINGSGYGYCIFVGNTTEHFIVRNCYLHEASGTESWPYYLNCGLMQYNVRNGRIEHNNISYNSYGANLHSSDYNVLFNNTFISNEIYGVRIYYSDINKFANNTVIESETGIYLDFAIGCNFTNNTLIKNGFYIYGSALEYWNTHEIDTSNEVNAKPVRFIKNQTSGLVSTGAGQVILANCTYFTVTDQDISNSSVGISLGFSSNNTIFRNIVTYNQVWGIYLSYSRDNNITGNTLLQNDMGVRFGYSDYNIMVDNDVSSGSLFGVDIYYSNNNQIIDNDVISNLAFGFRMFDASENQIINNTILNSWRGVFMDSCIHNEFRNNTVSSSGWWGIYMLDSSDNNTFETNNISNNGNGIYLQSCSFNNITNNDLLSNTGDGITLESSSNNTIRDNTVSDNQYGIYLESSSSNNITDNTVSNNDDGIACYSSSDNNMVMDNYVKSNDWDGIYLDWSSNNSIIANVILLNKQHGISLYYSSTNRLYHNNIIGNNIQAVDNMNDNFWNDTYPSGGNYWDDLFPIVDEYWGPLQNILGPDGINDSAYIIDTDSQDNYPLLNPVGNYTFLYEGWNLISIPLIQSDARLSSVLSSIEGKYDAVRRYNASDTVDPWKHNHTVKPSLLNDFDIIDHTMGFWIYITEPGGVLFHYFGVKPTISQEITLQEGWNLVGYPSSTVYNRTLGLNNTDFGIHLNSIWSYDAATQKWENMQESDVFIPGRGYWIHAKMNVVWQVPL